MGGQAIYLPPNVIRSQYVFRGLAHPRTHVSEHLWQAIVDWAPGDPEWVGLATSHDPGSGRLMHTVHQHKELLGAHGMALNKWYWEVS